MNIFDLLFYLALCGLGLYVGWWALAKAALPEPFNKVVTVVLVLITVYVVLGPLLGYISLPHFSFHT